MPQNHDPIAERAQEPTLPGFVAWLEHKDPNERYNWPMSEICACGQYAQDIGVKNWQANNNVWHKFNMLARGERDLPVHEFAPESGWTFGKLLERAKKALEPVK